MDYSKPGEPTESPKTWNAATKLMPLASSGIMQRMDFHVCGMVLFYRLKSVTTIAYSVNELKEFNGFIQSWPKCRATSSLSRRLATILNPSH